MFLNLSVLLHKVSPWKGRFSLSIKAMCAFIVIISSKNCMGCVSSIRILSMNCFFVIISSRNCVLCVYKPTFLRGLCMCFVFTGLWFHQWTVCFVSSGLRLLHWKLDALWVKDEINVPIALSAFRDNDALSSWLRLLQWRSVWFVCARLRLLRSRKLCFVSAGLLFLLLCLKKCAFLGGVEIWLYWRTVCFVFAGLWLLCRHRGWEDQNVGRSGQTVRAFVFIKVRTECVCVCVCVYIGKTVVYVWFCLIHNVWFTIVFIIYAWWVSGA